MTVGDGIRILVLSMAQVTLRHELLCHLGVRLGKAIELSACCGQWSCVSVSDWPSED